jgi:hypothetical protein
VADLNRDLNGSVACESLETSDVLPREVAHSVAEVSRTLHTSQNAQPSSTSSSLFADTAWAVDSAWNAVLAGDIDDLQRHISEEYATRGR